MCVRVYLKGRGVKSQVGDVNVGEGSISERRREDKSLF